MTAEKMVVWGVGTIVLMVLMVIAVAWFISYMNTEDILTVEEDEEVTLSFVSGTEYLYGDTGQVIVEARNKQGDAVQTNCTVDIWYPDKTLFIAEGTTNTSTSGNSFIEFTIPKVQGVYEYQANCTVLGQNRVVSKSFHVSPTRISAEVGR